MVDYCDIPKTNIGRKNSQIESLVYLEVLKSFGMGGAGFRHRHN